MANPALKNGYISIANELVEKLATLSIPSCEMRMIWVVWRKTWGWKDGDRKKDWDWISLSQFEKLTTIKHSGVSRYLKSLVVKRLLLKSEKGYKFNQNHDEWVVVKRLPPVVKRVLPSSQTTTKSSSQTGGHNRNKETNTKETHTDVVEIIDSFKIVNPTSYRKWFSNTTQQKSVKNLLKIHGKDLLIQVIKYLPQSNTLQYVPIITTPLQLEEKWAQLQSALIKKKSELKTKTKIAFI